MGQFDSETDAALAQLNYEALSETPGGEFAEIIGYLLMLVGTGGLWAVTGEASNLALKVRRLAGASYASNLVYAISAVRNDLATLYEQYENLRSRVDSLGSDPRFADAIAALALRAMHTSVKERLKRLARIVANGVKNDDLVPEGLDDMMRAAAELSNVDVAVLEFISSKQLELVSPGYKDAIYGWPDAWLREVQMRWQAALRERGKAFAQGEFNAGQWRSSLARLHSLGFVTPVQTNPTTNSPGEEPYGLLPLGQGFLERLQEIAVGR
jgi:hypothetical protein